jgi:hypothetical protein
MNPSRHDPDSKERCVLSANRRLLPVIFEYILIPDLQSTHADMRTLINGYMIKRYIYNTPRDRTDHRRGD